MAKKLLATPEFQLGSRVKIKNYSGPAGKIIELRGALGPSGMPIYRVAIPQKPVAFAVEVRGNQLELVTSPARKGIVIKARKPKQLKRSKSARKKTFGGRGSIV